MWLIYSNSRIQNSSRRAFSQAFVLRKENDRVQKGSICNYFAQRSSYLSKRSGSISSLDGAEWNRGRINVIDHDYASLHRGRMDGLRGWRYGFMCPISVACCGWAMPRTFSGWDPASVTASHRPSIEPCRQYSNRLLDA